MSNQYIPKYISQKPWYRSTEDPNQEKPAGEVSDLSHQYKDANVRVDHSKPIAGTGVNDEFEERGDVQIKKVGDWDSKRDRWHGVDVKQWDEIARNWDDIKKNINSKKQKKRGLSAGLNEDEDDSDTDYELELTELGLDQKDVTNKLREDPLEKTLRDRQDVPAYIQNINSGRSGKVSYEKLGDSKNSEIVNDQSEFVRGRTEEIKKLESFAWEQAEKSEKEQQRIILEKRLNGEMDVNSDGGGVLDLDLNLAANPTAIAVKVRQQEVEKRLEREIKRKKLEDRYN